MSAEPRSDRAGGLAALRALRRRDLHRPRHGSRAPRARATRRGGSSQALRDATAGYDGDPKLRTAFPSERPHDVDGSHSQIVEGPIAFHALCEHHALPFHGVAHVGYVAGPEILGISKLTRLVRLYARRFTVQERLGEQIADTLVELVAAARRRRSARGRASVHADARRRGGRLPDGDDVLARPLRRARRAARRVPRRGSEPPLTPLEVSSSGPGLPELDLPDGAASALRRRARLRRPLRLRELRPNDRRRRRDPGRSRARTR